MFKRTKPTDEHIVAQILAGHRDDFRILVQRYLPSVRAIAYAQTGNSADAEDVAQDAFLKAYQQINTLREKGKFRAWIGRIAQNLSRDLIVRRKRQMPWDPVAEQSLRAADIDPARREMRDLLQRKIGELEPGFRQVLLLHYYAGNNTRDVAQILGISQEAVKKRLQRGRAALSVELVEDVRILLEPVHDDDRNAHKIAGLALAAPVFWTPKAAAAATITISKLTISWILSTIVLAVSAAYFVSAPNPASEDSAAVLPDPPRVETPIQDAPSGDLAQAETTVEPTPQADLIDDEGSKVVDTGNSYDDSPAGFVRGFVRDTQGRAVPNALVTAHRLPYAPGKPIAYTDYVTETQTDIDGRYTFDGLPVRLGLPESHEYFLTASYQGRADSISVTPYPAYINATTDLVLRPGGFISGVVTDAAGAPIAGARVHPGKRRASWPDARSLFGGDFFSLWTETDDEGRFTTPLLEGETWNLFVSADGFAPQWTGFLPVGKKEVEVVLDSGFTVSGTVLSAENNEPVPGVRLILAHRQELFKHQFEVVSGADGQFQVGHLRPGNYYVRVEDEKWTHAQRSVKFEVSVNEDTPAIEVLVKNGVVLEGRVFEKGSGMGIAGASVCAFPNSTDVGGFYASWTDYWVVLTDDAGRYRMSGLPASDYRLSIVIDGDSKSHPYTERQEVEAGAVNNLDFPLAIERVLTGRVVDPDGQPVEGVQLETRISVGGPMRATSKADGSFRFDGFGDDQAKVRIKAEKPGFAMMPAGPYTVPEEGLHNVVLELEPEASIEGIVVDSGGAVVADAGITVRTPVLGVFAGGIGPHIRTDGQGRFKIDGLFAGDFYLTGVPPGTQHFGGRETLAEFSLTPGQKLRDLRVLYPQGANLTISGKVTGPRGSGIRIARVYCKGPVDTQTGVDLDNQFQLGGLEPGVYVLFVEDSGRWAGPIEVEAGASDLKIELPPFAKLGGRVVDAASGEPIEKFSIKWAEGHRDSMDSNTRWRRTYPQVEGNHFQLDSLPGAELTLSVQAQDYAIGFVHLTDLDAGTEHGDLEVLLDRAVSISGVVRDAAGRPLAGARVSAGGPEDNRSGGGASEKSGPEGEFTLAGLAPRQQSLTARHSDYAPATVKAVPGSPVEFVLSPGGVIQGQVTVDGTPLAGAYVVYQVEDAAETDVTVDSARTDSTGFFLFEHVTPGEGSVTFAQYFREEPCKGSVHLRQRVLVRERLVTEVSLALESGTAALRGQLVNTAPIFSGLVTLIPLGDGGQEYRALIKYDGTFCAERLIAGEYRVTLKYSFGEGGETVADAGRFVLEPGEVLNQEILLD